MPKKKAARSMVAQQTEGITLDHAANVYDLLAPLMTLGLEQRFHRIVLEQLALRGHEQILDIGCGTGALTRTLAGALSEPSARCIGLDAAERMIEVARRKAAGISNLQFDAALAENLPYAPRSFDAAVSAFFFHHVHFELKKKVLAETARVLRPGGRFLVVDVDCPTTRFGALCAWSGHWLFQQNEIAENIQGRLREAFDASPFSWQEVEHYSGYITVFELKKGEAQ
jgi:ubiquinone/menaquinone biosynthesis C-methylase UbiE